MKRRNFIQISALGAGTSLFAGTSAIASTIRPINQMDQLTSRIADIVPISLEERRSRIAKAQSLMDKNGFSAMVLDSGTSMNYFTGMTWGQSERPMVAVIPAKGEVSYI
ncbi:MAG: aminopeptidase P family N-terminal domain-containing protein, partial [Algoriphagus sp.]